METIGSAYKKALNNNFQFSLIERDEKGFLTALNMSPNKCVNMNIMPRVERIELKRIDEFHDSVRLYWSDYIIEGVVTWKPSSNKLNKTMVFYGIE